jgi:hypothetical protein
MLGQKYLADYGLRRYLALLKLGYRQHQMVKVKPSAQLH